MRHHTLPPILLSKILMYNFLNNSMVTCGNMVKMIEICTCFTEIHGTAYSRTPSN